MNTKIAALFTSFCVASGFAFPSLTGYAGSPVSSGSCAASCHGPANSFIPAADGWPSTAVPGQTYTVTISHVGNTINNFNACVLLHPDNSQIGTLIGGADTETYTHSGEGSGVRGSSNNRTSYTFQWMAPASEVGEMRLYVAVHELPSAGGPNGGGFFAGIVPTEMVLTCDIIGSDLELSWDPVPSITNYWVYGAENQAYFDPGFAPSYMHRLAVVPPGTTTWVSPYPVGDTENNWSYLVLAVNSTEDELGRSNRVGEHDFEVVIP